MYGDYDVILLNRCSSLGMLTIIRAIVGSETQIASNIKDI